MSTQRQSFPFNKGLDQSIIPIRADPGSFYNLHHFRHDDTQFGKLVQIPYCISSSTQARGTYYLAGALTEPATSAVRMYTTDFTVTDYCVNNGSGQVQVFYQTTVPTVENINTACRLVINDITASAITLGSSIDVEIHTDATHFRWRKNGGAYSADVVIGGTTGNVLDGGNFTIYWLTGTGFTVADLWSWTRTDASFSATTNVVARPLEYTYYKNELYFTATDGRLMVATNSSSAQYVISVGYRPVYASYFTFFTDHLVVAGYYPSTVAFFSNLRNTRIAWSDKTDIHNFVATDTNEADTYTLPNLTQNDAVAPFTTTSAICGISSTAQQCFVYSTTEIYTTVDLGLPLVFSWVKYMNVVLAGSVAGTLSPVVVGATEVYLIGRLDIFKFDGNGLTVVGRAINNLATLMTYGVFYKFRNELVLIKSQVAYICQLQYGTWYTRAVAFDAGSPTCIGVYSTELFFGATSRVTYREDSTWATTTPAFDATNGTVFTTPKVTTQAIGTKLSIMKEVSSTYLGALVTSVSATYYSTAADCEAKLYWYNTPTGIISGAPSTNAAAVWINTNPDGMISYPREAFRALALEVQLVGLSGTKPPGQFTLTAIEPLIYNTEMAKVEK